MCKLWFVFCLCVSGVLAANGPDDDATNWVNNIVAPAKNQLNLDSSSQGSPRKNCLTSDNRNGVCVKRSECNMEVKKIDPTTLFTLREGDCHYILACCPKELVKTTPVKPVIVVPTECGWSNPGASVFREKGNKNFADFGEFPWMVALLKNPVIGQKWVQEDYLGGGSLIHPSVVITAAHKVEDYEPKEIKCRAGEWDTQTLDEIYPFQERKVKKIVEHEDYFRLHSQNNIALLILTEPFSLSDSPHIGIACLGRSIPASGTRCFSMGWGTDFANKQKYAVTLKKLELPIVGDKQCEINLRNTRLGSTYTLHNSLMCAGGEEGKDTCVGDGGAPLVCPIGKKDDSERYAVHGLVAYGVGCGVRDVPGVYTNIAQLNRWIGEQVVKEGFPRTGFEY